MIEQHTNSLHRYSFDSLREVSQYIESAPRTWGNIRGSKNDRASERWDLNAGYDGAVRMAREGWIEGAQAAQAALQSFAPRSPNPDIKIDFFGHMPHVPRYCAGAPDSMYRHTTPPTVGGGKVITLYVNIVANASQNARCMSNFGLGIAQYINQLENDGIRVELHAGVVHEGARKRSCHTWLLKNASQPLDLAVISFAIGHPAMFRRLWFALAERSRMTPSSGYHRATDMRDTDIINYPRHAYILNGMQSANSNAPTPEQALEHIESQIKQAIELAE